VNRSLVRSGIALIGAALAFGLVEAAPATAINEYEGLTYAQAVGRLGARAKIASKVGSFLPTSQCVVTGSRSSSSLDSSGQSRGNTVLLDLNCNYAFSLPGVPGNSKASPEGKEAYEKALAEAEKRQKQQQAAAQQAAAEGA
jgi:hypothetical protein